MLRFILAIIVFFPYCIYFYFKARKAVRDKNATATERYGVVRQIITTICKKSRITVNSFGSENLPEKDGFVLISNHQGRFDGLAHIAGNERCVSFLIDEKRSNMPIEKTVVDALGCVRIDRTNLEKTRASLSKLKEEVGNGRNIVIFPEGGWAKNGNNLQEFKTGAIGTVISCKCTIVPVCLYDTYKVYGVNSLKKVSCRIHYLTPIPYSEYENMTRAEIADLIKERINEKLTELKSKEQ